MLLHHGAMAASAEAWCPCGRVIGSGSKARLGHIAFGEQGGERHVPPLEEWFGNLDEPYATVEYGALLQTKTG